MAIKENSDMRLTHNPRLSDRLLILCVMDILVIFWILWYESRIQYEPLLDYSLAKDVKTLPLIPETYNTIILTIITNIIVMIIEFKKKYTKIRDKYAQSILVLYVFIAISCLFLGYSYISSRLEAGVISETNILFRFPILFLGKNTVTSIQTAMNLYVVLCVSHICTCIIYVTKCVYPLLRISR